MTTGLRHEFADFRKEIKAELLAAEQRLDGRIDRIDGRIDGLDGRIDGLQADVGDRIDGLQADVGGRIDRLQAEVGGRIDRLQAEVGGMRSDLTQVALAVGVKPRASNG
jgi:hypothetical protein